MLAEVGSQALASGDAGTASSALREALGLWRGPAYAEFESRGALGAEASRLELLRLDAVRDRITADLALPDSSSAVGELDDLVRRYPTHEAFWALLMRALYRDGRQADALQAYLRARTALVEELGIEPGPALQRVHGQVLDQNPALGSGVQRFLPAQPAVVDAPAIGASGIDGGRALAPERRRVTILVVDLESDNATDGLADLEDREASLDGLRAVVVEAAAEFGGQTMWTVGPQCLVAFGVPSAHDDDAIRATQSAVVIRDRVAERFEGARVRAALATGNALAAEMRVSGPPVSEAVTRVGRLDFDHISVDATTRRLTQHIAQYTKDLPWSMLLELSVTSAQARAVSSTPFVGRAAELDVLTAAMAATAKSAGIHVVTVVGEPGMGKSRLVGEFAQRVSGVVQSLTGRCRPYGDAATLAPLVDLLCARADIHEGDPAEVISAKVRSVLPAREADQLAHGLLRLLGGETSGSTSRSGSFESWSRFLELLAAPAPALVIIEDLHWASDVWCEFLEDLFARGMDGRLLLVVTARPELWHERPHWPAGPIASTTFRLAPLTDAETTSLVASVGGGLAASVRAGLVARSAGVPLYAEEFARLMMQRTGPSAGDSDDIPDAIAAVLQARLDSLSSTQRRVLECAAVAGDPFWADQMAAISDQPNARSDLNGLAQRGFVTRSRDAIRQGDIGYSISHELVRRAAYDRLTRAVRAHTHLAVATWWQEFAGDRFGEFSERIGYHGATAHDLAVLSGEHAIAEAARPLACRGLMVTAEALHALDVPTCLRLLERAMPLADDGTEEWNRLRTRYAEALADDGQYDRCEEVVADLLPVLEATNDRMRVDAAVALLLAQFNLGHDLEPSVAAFQRAREELPPGVESARATAMLAMTHVIRQTTDSMRAAIVMAEEAIRLAAIDNVDLGTAHIARGRARLALGDQDGMEELERGLSQVSAFDPVLAIVGGRQWLAGALHHWRGPRAEWQARRGLAEMAETRGLASLVSMGAAEEVRVLAELGLLREAIAAADALDVGAQAQMRWAVVQRALALLDLGELTESTVAQVLATPPADPTDLRHVLGVALVAAASAAQAERFDQVRRILAELGSWEPYLDRDGAVELVPRLVRTARAAGVADLISDLSTIPQNGTPLRRYLAAHVSGQLAAMRGDHPTAAASFTEALTGWIEFGAAYETAYARIELASALNDTAADGLKSRAATDFVAMGMPPVPWDIAMLTG
jgi:class 3 adenylate cyclase